MCPSKSATCLGVNSFTVPSSARTPVTSFVAKVCRKLCKPFFSIPAASSMEENRFLKFNGLVKFPSASGINGASSPKYRSLRNSIIACTAVSFKGTIRLLEAVFSLPTTISRPLFLSVPSRFWHHKRACIFSP